jgi:hypothetical protein
MVLLPYGERLRSQPTCETLAGGSPQVRQCAKTGTRCRGKCESRVAADPRI